MISFRDIVHLLLLDDILSITDLFLNIDDSSGAVFSYYMNLAV